MRCYRCNKIGHYKREFCVRMDDDDAVHVTSCNRDSSEQLVRKVGLDSEVNEDVKLRRRRT